MRTQKSNKEGKTSKVLEFQLPMTTDGTPTTNLNAGKKGNSHTVFQLAGRSKGAGTRPSQAVPRHFPSEEELRARIAKRAYELFEQRERQHGYDWGDWFQAEKDILPQKDVG